MQVRHVRPSDTDRLGAILAATGADVPRSLDAYLGFVVADGSLLVAETGPRPDGDGSVGDGSDGDGSDGDVVGFGGAVVLDDGTVMVTDLFVDPRWHGRRVGSTLLEALVADRPERMTFSSQHAAALPSYRRQGMLPRWRLLTFGGVIGPSMVEPSAGGPSTPTATEPGDDASAATAAAVLGRRTLSDWFVAHGATVLLLHEASGATGSSAHTAGGPVGAAIVVSDDDVHTVSRLVTTGDHVPALRAVATWLGVGTRLHCSVPDHSPVADWLASGGLAVLDADVCASTMPEPVPSGLVAMHPGLC